MAPVPQIARMLADDAMPAPGTPADRRVLAYERAALRVLVTLVKPEWRHLPVRERARRCRLTINRYAAIAGSEQVRELLCHVTQATVARAVPDLIDDIVANSRLPSRDGLGDRRLLLSLATGRNGDRSEHVVKHEIGPNLAAALARESAGRAAELAAPVLEHKAAAPARAAIPAAIIDVEAVPTRVATRAVPQPPERTVGNRRLLDEF